MGTAILLIGVAAVLFLLFRIFYARMRWYLSDLYSVLVLSSLPPAFLSQLFRADEFNELRGIMTFVIIALFIDAPVFVGAWWGLNSAQRLGEVRIWARFGLIMSGVLAFLGFIAGVIFIAEMLQVHPGRNPEMFIVAAVGSVAIALLFYPAWRVEQACRRRETAARERAMRRPKNPVPSVSPGSAALPSLVQNQTSTPQP